MINGLDIYYSKNIGRGLKPVSNNKGRGLKPVSNNKGKGCKQIHGRGLKILQ